MTADNALARTVSRDWKLKPGAEDSFVDAWSRIPVQLQASAANFAMSFEIECEREKFQGS